MSPTISRSRPRATGALIATVNCLKAFGEQIKITVTSRANPLAKAECTLDYARRILDTALYHEGMDTNILDFGSDEILVDMVIPSYDEFLAEMDGEGELWVGGYYQTFIGDYHLTPDDINDPLASWADVYLEQTYKFSDYTIKDCMVVVSETDKQYEVEFESVCEVPKGIQEIVYNFAIATNEGQIFTYDQIASSREMRFGNNPIFMLIDMLTGYGGIGMSDFNEANLSEVHGNVRGVDSGKSGHSNNRIQLDNHGEVFVVHSQLFVPLQSRYGRNAGVLVGVGSINAGRLRGGETWKTTNLKGIKSLM